MMSLQEDINSKQIEKLLEQRYILIKKGKTLGRNVIRWGQFHKERLIYFKYQNSTVALGFYSLYQIQCTRTTLKASGDMAKVLNVQPKHTLDALKLTNPALSINFFLLPYPYSNVLDIMHSICILASQGELTQHLSNHQASRNTYHHNLDLDYNDSIGHSSEDESRQSLHQYSRKTLLTRGQRLLPTLAQSVKIESHTELIYDVEEDADKHFSPLKQECHSNYNTKLNSKRPVITHNDRQQLQEIKQQTMRTEEVTNESENLESTSQSRKLLGTLQLMKRGVSSKPKQLTKSKTVGMYKACQNLTMNLSQSFLKNKAANNLGDQDDLHYCDEEEKQPVKRFIRRVSQYDNDDATNSLLMESNPFEAFSKFEDFAQDQSEAGVQKVITQTRGDFNLLTNINEEPLTPQQTQENQDYLLDALTHFQQQPSCFDFFEVEHYTPMEALYLGIEASWDFKLKYASKIFSYYSQQGDIRHQLHKLELSFFKVMITGKKSLIDKCMKKVLKFDQELQQIKVVIQKNKQQSIKIQYKKNEEEYESGFLNSKELINDITHECLDIICAEVLMFKGVLRFLAGCRFKAFLIFRESYKIFKKYEQYLTCDQAHLPLWFEADLRSRVQLGIGLFYLGLSALPKSLTTIIRLIGFSANRDKGKLYLQTCIQERRSRSVYASLILCLFHLDQEPQYESVCSNLITLLQTFPHSSLFLWVTSIVSWKYSQLDDAVFFIQRALQTLPEKLRKEAAFLKYEIGWFHYLKLEFDQSLNSFKDVLRDCLNLEYDIDDHNGLPVVQEEEHSEEMIVKKDVSMKKSSIYENVVHKLKFTQMHSESESPQKLDIVLHQSPSQISSGIPQRKEDFVYLPHRACLTMQLAGVYVALKRHDYVTHWLQTTIELAHQPSITRSKLDQEMGHLAYIYLTHRQIKDLLTYEIIYFLHQMPKLPNSILFQIIADITTIMRNINLSINTQDPSVYKDSPYLPDYISGMMLTIICYCFLGDQEIATLFSERLVKATQLLPSHFNYLTVHALYWSARSFLAQGYKKEAEETLLKAKRYKKYEFPIDSKIDRVLADMRQSKL